MLPTGILSTNVATSGFRRTRRAVNTDVAVRLHVAVGLEACKQFPCSPASPDLLSNVRSLHCCDSRVARAVHVHCTLQLHCYSSKFVFPGRTTCTMCPFSESNPGTPLVHVHCKVLCRMWHHAMMAISWCSAWALHSVEARPVLLSDRVMHTNVTHELTLDQHVLRFGAVQVAVDACCCGMIMIPIIMITGFASRCWVGVF